MEDGRDEIGGSDRRARGNDYLVYADTYINTIAVDQHVWAGRLLRGRGTT